MEFSSAARRLATSSAHSETLFNSAQGNRPPSGTGSIKEVQGRAELARMWRFAAIPLHISGFSEGAWAAEGQVKTDIVNGANPSELVVDVHHSFCEKFSKNDNSI